MKYCSNLAPQAQDRVVRSSGLWELGIVSTSINLDFFDKCKKNSSISGKKNSTVTLFQQHPASPTATVEFSWTWHTGKFCVHSMQNGFDFTVPWVGRRVLFSNISHRPPPARTRQHLSYSRKARATAAVVADATIFSGHHVLDHFWGIFFSSFV